MFNDDFLVTKKILLTHNNQTRFRRKRIGFFLNLSLLFHYTGYNGFRFSDNSFEIYLLSFPVEPH